MKTFQDLNSGEQALFNKVEGLFINHPSVDIKSFIKVLGVLINKFKNKEAE